MSKHIIKMTSDKCYGVKEKSAMRIRERTFNSILQTQGNCSNDIELQTWREQRDER